MLELQPCQEASSWVIADSQRWRHPQAQIDLSLSSQLVELELAAFSSTVAFFMFTGSPKMCLMSQIPSQCRTEGGTWTDLHMAIIKKKFFKYCGADLLEGLVVQICLKVSWCRFA